MLLRHKEESIQWVHKLSRLQIKKVELAKRPPVQIWESDWREKERRCCWLTQTHSQTESGRNFAPWFTAKLQFQHTAIARVFTLARLNCAEGEQGAGSACKVSFIAQKGWTLSLPISSCPGWRSRWWMPWAAKASCVSIWKWWKNSILIFWLTANHLWGTGRRWRPLNTEGG